MLMACWLCSPIAQFIEGGTPSSHSLCIFIVYSLFKWTHSRGRERKYYYWHDWTFSSGMLLSIISQFTRQADECAPGRVRTVPRILLCERNAFQHSFHLFYPSQKRKSFLHSEWFVIPFPKDSAFDSSSFPRRVPGDYRIIT